MFQCRRQLSGVTQSWSCERGRGGGMKERVKENDRERQRENVRNEIECMRVFFLFSTQMETLLM